MTWIWYAVAALAEIFGCFAFWLWLRESHSAWWILAGTVSLIVFALSLTRVEVQFAGRAFAAYGGIYIVASLAWLHGVEKSALAPTDLLGAALCLAGAAVILAGAR